MAVTLNASTTAGLVTSADTSGNLDLQAGGVTKIAVTSAGANIVGTLTVNGVAPSSGKVLQVVQGIYTATVTTNSSTFGDTGVTATITPSSTSSKILVLAQLSGCGKETNNTQMQARIVKNGSALSGMESGAGYIGASSSIFFGAVVANYLDSPASTSALTYKIQFASVGNNNVVVVNNNSGGGSSSSITLLEIAA